MREAGIQGQHLAYKGSSQAMTDLASGQVQAMFSSLPSMKGMVDKGLIRVVAVTAESKSPTYKDYPLIKKTLPGFEYATWYGIYGPADMPKPIVQRLSQSLNKLGADRGLASYFPRGFGRSHTQRDCAVGQGHPGSWHPSELSDNAS